MKLMLHFKVLKIVVDKKVKSRKTVSQGRSAEEVTYCQIYYGAKIPVLWYVTRF